MLLSSCVHIQTSKHFTLVEGVDLLVVWTPTIHIYNREGDASAATDIQQHGTLYKQCDAGTRRWTAPQGRHFYTVESVCACACWVLCTFSSTSNKHLKSRRSRWRQWVQSRRRRAQMSNLSASTVDVPGGVSATLPQSHWGYRIFLRPH